MNNKVEFIDAQGMARLKLSTDIQACRPFLNALMDECSTRESRLVDNIATKSMLLQVGSAVLPLTINTQDFDNSWVCSPYNATVTYPLEELRHIDSAFLRTGLAGMIHGIAPALKFGRVNQVVCVNNWFLSTNLYPEIQHQQIRQLTAAICDRFPNHAILFRSLNAFTNGTLMDALRSEGYLMAPSRQVYLYDGRQPDYLSANNSRRDRKLLATTDAFSTIPHDDFSTCSDSRIKELYDLLYLKKYSYHNPQFSERLIKLWRESGMMKMCGLSNTNGQLDGVVGTFTMNGVMTAPLVGYDTAKPQQAGLYRMLMAHVLNEAANQNVVLNLSAGAASFKRLRGGRPELEYSAVYTRHLPFRQRTVWATLATILEQVGGRVLRRFQL